jgi:uncharacterized protein YjaG (DUF416 family)
MVMSRDLIQIRRGNENTLPILSQGELAMTTDSEKLFIGGVSGNVRINGTKSVNVTDFGAVGDGVTDDSNAFQSAINTGKTVLIPMSDGQNYLIQNSVTVNTISQTLTVENDFENNGKITIDTQEGFIINNENVRFIGLSMVSLNGDASNHYNTAIKVNGNATNGASDCHFVNNRFGYFEKAIDNIGRGVRVEGNRFVYCGECLSQFYNYIGADLQTTARGNRALRFTNNRIHGSSTMVNNKVGYLLGAKIENNIADVGGIVLVSSDSMRECQINNNVVTLTLTTPIQLLSGDYTSNSFSNNTFMGDGADRRPDYFMIVESTVGLFDKNKICNNILDDCDRTAIIFEKDITNCAINNNVIKSASQVVSNADACIAISNITDCSISNNSFQQASTISPIRGLTTGATLNGCQIRGNVSNLIGEIITSMTIGVAKTNNIQPATFVPV